MKRLSYSFFFIWTIFFSCDPGYNVAFVVDNQTNGTLSLTSRLISQDSSDFNSIDAGSEIILFQDAGLGSDTKFYLDQMATLPFSEIILRLDDSLEYTKGTLDIDNWEKVYPQRASSNGKVILSLQQEDFDN